MSQTNNNHPVVLGCEQIFNECLHLIDGHRVGLITNHSGVDSLMKATADKLYSNKNCELTALFGPEHGIRGSAQDGETVDSFNDPYKDVPAFSLYGKTRQPNKEMLSQIDRMLFDIQDVGVRFYTFLYTMSMSMEACADHDIPFIVLDRPNPIGGIICSGNILNPLFESFVGRYPIATRYGLTIGELANLFNNEFNIGVELHVIRMKNWERGYHWGDCHIPWVPPSPNMPTFQTSLVYPGTCFFEGTNISEGRGTTKPFEQIGAPFIDAMKLADILNDINLAGVRFRPTFFTPTYSKYTGESCGGVQIHVLNNKIYDPIEAGFASLIAIRNEYQNNFVWKLPAGGIHNFDRLAGTNLVREAIDDGCSTQQLLASWEPELKSFRKIQERYMLY